MLLVGILFSEGITLREINYLYLSLSCFVAVISLFTVSCGAQRTFQSNPPTGGFAKYVIVEVQDFKTSLDYVPADAVWTISNQIAEQLKEKDLFAGVSRSPVDLTDRVLIISGSIVDFEPQEWYKQAFKTIRVAADVRFIDKASNRIVAEATFEGSAKGGAVSGGIFYAYKRMADEIVEYMQLNYR